MSKNKVIGTRGQGVGVLCPRELTTEHLTEASLQLEEPLCGSARLQLEEPLLGSASFQLQDCYLIGLDLRIPTKKSIFPFPN